MYVAWLNTITIAIKLLYVEKQNKKQGKQLVRKIGQGHILGSSQKKYRRLIKTDR